MNIGEVLWKIQKRAAELALDVWNNDYSFMGSKFLFGFDMIDVIALILALLIVYELIKRAMNLVGEFISFLSRHTLETLYKFVLYLLRRIIARALFTLRYFWNHPKVAAWTYEISIHFDNLVYRLHQFKN